MEAKIEVKEINATKVKVLIPMTSDHLPCYSKKHTERSFYEKKLSDYTRARNQVKMEEYRIAVKIFHILEKCSGYAESAMLQKGCVEVTASFTREEEMNIFKDEMSIM